MLYRSDTGSVVKQATSVLVSGNWYAPSTNDVEITETDAINIARVENMNGEKSTAGLQWTG
jgi:hypothetical protein